VGSVLNPILRVQNLGVMDYKTASELQLRTLHEVADGSLPPTLLIVEHPPVYTVGLTRGAEANLLEVGDVPIVNVRRGGDVTFHGPGQIVIYPIIPLMPPHQDIHKHMRRLEQAAIDTCEHFGLKGVRDERNTGVWVGDRKICAIGVAAKRWVTWHGMAMNVTTDINYFKRINPCGMDARLVTTMATELNEPPTIKQVSERLIYDLREALQEVLGGGV
jgi:lipoyl(octanoyl) transferase